MKEIFMITLEKCPYCKEAFDYIHELKKENPNYEQLNITVIDEQKEPEKIQGFNYYYVPTFYVEDIKAHEGVPSKEIIQKVLDSALE
ncbi:thioredoxin-like protein [Natranaerovirga hydrolytica]|uniref:Thioredoxin-like protein n=1 Tax=Natranaerovirga hydrolytica TaxID=680378 RepID=A0A4R1MKA9_9FIRM|nr:thioredoxin family protein [Natranaerovirga hydrolytica]TCK93248.1 thioredoxin-like protein [Natranaerovirga hydrolytica]